MNLLVMLHDIRILIMLQDTAVQGLYHIFNCVYCLDLMDNLGNVIHLLLEREFR